MIILRILFYAFLIYLAYRLVFDFIIPVYRTTRQVKRGFRAMQDRMREQADSQHARPGSPPQSHPATPPAGDYIDFEEVK